MSKKGGSKTKEEAVATYDLRDVVLAKVKGFPPWPGMIVDPEGVPAAVAKERPQGKKTTWYAVRFFPTGDYAWLVSKDISKLKEHEINAYIAEPHKRNGELLEGYKIAQDPTPWEAKKDDEIAQAQEDMADAQVDELDDEEGSEKSSKSKKRKREADTSSTKKNTATKKAPAKKAAEPKKKAAAGKGKKNGVKSKEMVESEEDEDEDAGPSKAPPNKKHKKDAEDDVDPAVAADPEAQKVREWRHKLQKMFLNQKQPPSDEDMPAMNELFTTIESYENMQVPYLQFSKIGKVMRHIQSSDESKILRDGEFKFRDRAKVLVDRWHNMLHSHKTASTANGDADEDGKGDMDVDAKGEPDPAMNEDKENEDKDAAGEEVNMSAMDGDLTVGDISMAETTTA